MRGRLIASPRSEAVCAFCNLRLSGAHLARPGRQSRLGQRHFSVASSRLQAQQATKEAPTSWEDTQPSSSHEQGGSGGWGSSDGAADSWGSASQPGKTLGRHTANRAQRGPRSLRPLNLQFHDKEGGNSEQSRRGVDQGNSGGQQPREAPLFRKFWAPGGPTPSEEPNGTRSNESGASKSQVRDSQDDFSARRTQRAFQQATFRMRRGNVNRQADNLAETPEIERSSSSDTARGQPQTSWRHVKLRRDEGNEVEEANATQGRTENPARSQYEAAQRSRWNSARNGAAVSWDQRSERTWQPRRETREFAPREQATKDEKPPPAAPTFRKPDRDKSKRAAKFSREENIDEEDSSESKPLRRDKTQRNDTRKNVGAGRRAIEEDEIEYKTLVRMEKREQRKAERQAKRTAAPPTPIVLPNFISVGNLGRILRVRAEDFTKKLGDLGFEGLSNDHILGAEDAGLIAQEFNYEPTTAPQEEAFEDLVARPEPTAEDKEFMLNRPPVITIMGHVDHGKTTLLDFLRNSSVAAGEHGGITQHIGAFTVEMSSGRTITFLDTPGHAAFLDMRARGANVTDIVILVVAADDSVKPQTLEAIKHARAAGVPIIVAISKVDKEEADPDRVKRDLARNGVEVEDFGGDVQAIPVSGKTGEGMEDLEEAAIALADILDVRADTAGAVEGYVLESSVKRAGKVATVLVRRGTVRPGNVIVAGQTWAKVRTLKNEAGAVIMEATPGQPIEIDGWDEQPDAGAEVLEAPSLQRARQVCEHRQTRAETERLAVDVAASNEARSELRQQRTLAKEQAESQAEGEPLSPELQAAADMAKANKQSSFIRVPLIIKGDVSGSVEAVTASVLSLGNNEIRVEVLRNDVGSITESDVELAGTAQGVIVNFGVQVPPEMRRLAEAHEVRIIDGNVIYRITDEVKAHLEDTLPPLRLERVIGAADIAMVFEYSMKGRGKVPVAGCRVINGVVAKGKRARISRNGALVFDGPVSSLKSHKKDVDEMQKGTECGMSFEGFTDFQAGDSVQAYEIYEERRQL